MLFVCSPRFTWGAWSLSSQYGRPPGVFLCFHARGHPGGAEDSSTMLPSLYTGTPAFWPPCLELSLNRGNEGADDGRDKKNDAVPGTFKSVQPDRIAMNISHNCGVGLSLVFWVTARTAVSCNQFTLPVLPEFVRFRHRPLGSRMKSSGLQSFTRIAVAVGVVVMAEYPCPPSLVGGAEVFSSQYDWPAGVAFCFQVGDDPGAII